jgi:tetratricopeptide (TPR) repeat protein
VDDVYELMARAEDLPYGEARTILIEDALRRAEAAGDEVLAHRVRMELTSAYQHGGEPARAFTSFSRCLAERDADPSRFGDEARLLWHFKWIVNSLTLFPEIPLDRTYAVLDDMERRYRLGGYSLQAVYHYRHVVAQHVGDQEAAEEWFARWRAAPRDQLSDCAGCDPTGMVRHLTSRGRHEEALELATPVLRSSLACTEQPQNILTALLPCYLHTGRLDEARDAHRRAYRLTRSHIRDLSDIADHLEFCVQTGNEARGLEILQRHLGWFDRAPSPHAAMRFAAAGALVLRRLAETGHGDLRVPRPPEGEMPLDELRAELTGFALTTAGRFDGRNGSGYQGDQIRDLLGTEPVIDHLPLTPYAARSAPSPPPAPAPEVTDPGALLDLAEEHWTRRETEAALAAWRRFDELVPEPELRDDPAAAGRRADGHGYERIVGGDADGAAADWERAAALHARAGDETRRHASRARAGSALAGTGRAEEGLALMESALADLERVAPGDRRTVAARLRLASAYAEAGRAAEAVRLLDAMSVDAPMDVADVELARAQAFADLGQDDDAIAALRRACDGYRAAGVSRTLSETLLMLAQRLLRDDPPAGPGDEILALLDEAVAHAPADLPGLRPAALGTRGNRLMDHGRYADAVEDLIETVAGFTATGMSVQAAYARLDLTLALLNTGRHFEAAEAAEEAVPMLGELGDVQAERRGRFLLAHAQRELGEQEAAETFTALAREAEDDGTAAGFLETAAEVLIGLDIDRLAADRFLEAVDRYAAAGDLEGVVRARRRAAMSLAWSGRPDDAHAEIAKARIALSGVTAESDRDWEAALLAYDESRILARYGRFDEALFQVSEAIDGFSRLNDQEAVAAAEAFRQDIRTARAEEA